MRWLIPHPLLSLTVALIWLLLNGAAPGDWVLAAAVGVLVPRVTAVWWPDRPRLRRPHLLIPYGALVLADILRANFEVAWVILFLPPDRIRSTFLTVPISLTQPEAVALLAATITLTPGTLTADIAADRQSLLIHALHAPDPAATIAAIKTRYEARLKRIFP